MPAFLALRQFNHAHPLAEQTALFHSPALATTPHVISLKRRILDKIGCGFHQHRIRLLVDFRCVFRLQVTEDETVLIGSRIRDLVASICRQIDGYWQ